MRRLATLLLAAALVGSLNLNASNANPVSEPDVVEVSFGALVSGSTAGVNLTNASASVTGALTTTTTNVWYVNNTNATSPYWVKLRLENTPTLTALTTLRIGLNNGTATSDQVVASLGSLTQTEGAYLRIEPSSTNRIYVQHLVGLTFSAADFDLRLVSADDLTEAALVTTKARLSLT